MCLHSYEAACVHILQEQLVSIFLGSSVWFILMEQQCDYILMENNLFKFL